VAGFVLEEGESSRGGGGGGVWAGTGNGENGEVGVECYSDFVLSAMGAAPIMGLSFGGNQKRLMHFFFFLLLKRVGFLKMGFLLLNLRKGKRELKSLECSFNFKARSRGSSWRKGKTAFRA
jgi:hypothetical protein